MTVAGHRAFPTGEPQPRPRERSVTLLGATGSIGASTVDLIKRERERFRVEAVSANSNAAALAEHCARDSARALPRSAIRRPIANSRTRSRAPASKPAPARRRWSKRRSAPRDWVIGAITGAAGLRPTLGGGRARRHRRARQQGMPGLRRRPVHAPRRRGGRDGAAGRFRAQCAVPGDERRPARRRAPRDSDRFGRTVPNLEREAIQAATLEQALKHPNWSMGPRSRSIRRR